MTLTVLRREQESVFLDIMKALKDYVTASKVKSVEMVLEAFESMEAKNIRSK